MILLRRFGYLPCLLKEIVQLQNRISELECLATSCTTKITGMPTTPGVADSEMRMILSLRYVNALSWDQVTYSIGGGNSEDGVKKKAYRFLKKTNEN
ncbi:MAG: hypothetical protein RR744_10260 [Cellulosilyticaceae bacterium]